MSAGQAWAGAVPATVSQAERHHAYSYYDRYYAPYLPPDRGARLLDFGCGFCLLLGYLTDRGYRDVQGVDVDRRCVDFCLSQGCAAVHVPDSRAFLRENPAAFDLVMLREVAYYFPPDEAAGYFDDLRTALKLGGRMLVQAFNGATATGFFPSLNDRWIRTVFTEHSLRWTLEASRFDVLALFGASGIGQGPRYRAWRAAAMVWARVLGTIYLLERGRDPLNPTILDKTLIAVAEPRI